MTTGPGRIRWTSHGLLCLPVASEEAKVHSKDLSKCSMQRMLAAFVFGIRVLNLHSNNSLFAQHCQFVALYSGFKCVHVLLLTCQPSIMMSVATLQCATMVSVFYGHAYLWSTSLQLGAVMTDAIVCTCTDLSLYECDFAVRLDFFLMLILARSCQFHTLNVPRKHLLCHCQCELRMNLQAYQ